MQLMVGMSHFLYNMPFLYQYEIGCVKLKGREIFHNKRTIRFTDEILRGALSCI